MRQFKLDISTAYKWFAILLGFYSVGLGFGYFVLDHKLHGQQWWFAVAIIAVPSLLLLSQAWEYFSIENTTFVINTIFRKKKISLENLQALKYEGRLADHVLVIEYLENDVLKIEEIRIRPYSTKTLEEMNITLKKASPKLSINIDEGSKKYMEKNRELHTRTPITLYGWVGFMLKYYLLSGLLVAIFLFIAFRSRI